MSHRDKLARVSDPSDVQVQAATTDSPDRLRALSDHRDKKVRVAVAFNPAAPKDLLETLVADKHHLVRYALAERADGLAWSVVLAADDPGVRAILAQRQDLDEATLEALLADPARTVRESVATSTQRPDVLARLARDTDHHVRATTATNLNIADDDLELLAADRVGQVRAVAAQNPRLGPESVTRLAADRSGNVRYFVLEAHPERLDLAEALKEDKESDIARLARNRLTADAR
jgi:hypothetical protein